MCKIVDVITGTLIAAAGYLCAAINGHAAAPLAPLDLSASSRLLAGAKVTEASSAPFAKLRPARITVAPKPAQPKATAAKRVRKHRHFGSLRAAPENVRSAAAQFAIKGNFVSAQFPDFVGDAPDAAKPQIGKYSPLWFARQDLDETAAVFGEGAVTRERAAWRAAARAAAPKARKAKTN